jgi:hypothetical protein
MTSGLPAFPMAEIRPSRTPTSVDNHGRRDHEIGRSCASADARRLPHAVANDLAAAELGFVAVYRPVAIDANDELGVGQTDAVARRGPVMIRIRPSIDLHFISLSA